MLQVFKFRCYRNYIATFYAIIPLEGQHLQICTYANNNLDVIIRNLHLVLENDYLLHISLILHLPNHY